MSTIAYREPQTQELEEFWKGLREHNAQFVTNTFVQFMRVATINNAIVGGINGVSYWRKMQIENLWVKPKHRKAGIGTALMNLAEEEARRRGCSGVILDTMSFQALEFYMKRGYRQFGAIDGYENNTTKHYLHKVL